ncbi:MAG: HvfC/BufC N-terminal domain-containing protein [Pseudobdellovibrionaceae bacterium]
MKKKKSLVEIQIALQDAIVNRNLSTSLKNEILENPPISIERRLEIYQDAYQIRMIASLRDDFPLVEEKVGDAFQSIALEFLQLYPSVYRNLAEVSQHFPDYLKNKSKDLYELAVQDWLMALASYAPELSNNENVTVQEIQNGVEFQIKKHPATFTAISPTFYLVYRHLSEYHVSQISEREVNLLEFVKSAKSLEQFSEKSFELGFTNTELSDLLSHWMQKEIVFCERKLK